MTNSKEIYNQLVDLLIVKEGLHINEIKQFLSELTIEKFNDIAAEISKSDEPSLLAQFIYYLKLFRNNDKIKSLLNNNELSLAVLEKLIFFSFAQASINGTPEDMALDDILIFINQEKYLKLLLESEIILHDKLLSYYLLTKLDRKNIDVFFNNHPNIIEYLNGFIILPERTIRTILAKNPDLFGYISLFLQTLNKEKADLFIKKYEIDINEMENIKSIILSINNNYDLKKEKSLPLSERDKNRLHEIVYRIKGINNVFNFLYTLESEGVVIDEAERNLIQEILDNPMFKNILYKYSEKMKNFE